MLIKSQHLKRRKQRANDAGAGIAQWLERRTRD